MLDVLLADAINKKHLLIVNAIHSRLIPLGHEAKIFFYLGINLKI